MLADLFGDSEVERFCNDVAGEFLLPARELDLARVRPEVAILRLLSDRVSALADKFNVSRTMVAYKAYRSLRINQETFVQLSASFRQEWREARTRARAKAREREDGPSYYVVRRHRLGGRIINLVRRMMAADALSTSKAARILGVKSRQVQPLLGVGRLP